MGDDYAQNKRFKSNVYLIERCMSLRDECGNTRQHCGGSLEEDAHLSARARELGALGFVELGVMGFDELVAQRKQRSTVARELSLNANKSNT